MNKENNFSIKNSFTISEKQMNNIVKQYFIDTKQLNIKNMFFGNEKATLEFYSNKTLDNEAIIVTSTFSITKELILDIVKNYLKEKFKANILNNLVLEYKYSTSHQDENTVYIVVSYDDTMTI